jgi:hypothetical protein
MGFTPSDMTREECCETFKTREVVGLDWTPVGSNVQILVGSIGEMVRRERRWTSAGELRILVSLHPKAAATSCFDLLKQGVASVRAASLEPLNFDRSVLLLKNNNR